MADTEFVGLQRDIKMSTAPSPSAEYVGNSVC
jgi:hypothetical protein